MNKYLLIALLFVCTGLDTPKEVIESEMVSVQGGTFMMGSNDSLDLAMPMHQVTVSSFSIGLCEVSQEQWVSVMGKNPSIHVSYQRHFPVENVSWLDVQEFLRRLNKKTGKHYRLPTEAEWEFAARGGNASKGYAYAGSNIADSVAWYYKEKDWLNPRRSAIKLPNELGLFDMSGNVKEWCSDWYGKYNSEHQTNPQGPQSGPDRIIRGGSYALDSTRCRVTRRGYGSPSAKDLDLGFRLACDN